MYPSIFNRLRAIARYWSKIATFPYPLAFNAPLGVIPLDDLRDFCRKSRNFYTHVFSAQAGGDPVGISWRCLMLVKLEWLGYRIWWKKLWRYVKPFLYNTILSRTDRQTHRRTDRRTDGQTDRRTELLYQYRASVCWRAIKMTQYMATWINWYQNSHAWSVSIFNVCQKTDARYSYRLDVCLSVRLHVCPSVCHTRWYCVE